MGQFEFSRRYSLIGTQISQKQSAFICEFICVISGKDI